MTTEPAGNEISSILRDKHIVCTKYRVQTYLTLMLWCVSHCAFNIVSKWKNNIQFVFWPNTAIKTVSIIHVSYALISPFHGRPNYVCLIHHSFMHNIVNVNVQFRRKIECIRQRIFWYCHGTTRSLHCAAVRAASVIKQGPRVGGRGIDRTVSSDLLLKVEGCIASPMRQGSRKKTTVKGWTPSQFHDNTSV